MKGTSGEDVLEVIKESLCMTITLLYNDNRYRLPVPALRLS